jgi:hypothetical protein
LLFLAFSLLSSFLLSFSFTHLWFFLHALFDFAAYSDEMWCFGETRSQRQLTVAGIEPAVVNCRGKESGGS